MAYYEKVLILSALCTISLTLGFCCFAGAHPRKWKLALRRWFALGVRAPLAYLVLVLGLLISVPSDRDFALWCMLAAILPIVFPYLCVTSAISKAAVIREKNRITDGLNLVWAQTDTFLEKCEDDIEYRLVLSEKLQSVGEFSDEEIRISVSAVLEERCEILDQLNTLSRLHTIRAELK